MIGTTLSRMAPPVPKSREHLASSEEISSVKIGCRDPEQDCLAQGGLDDYVIASLGQRVRLKVKPQHTETITEIRARINKQYGLPQRVITEVVTKSPYRPRVFAMVKNSHENAQGSSFAVYQIIDITKLFKRFVRECQPVTVTTATHPDIEGRFKMVRRE